MKQLIYSILTLAILGQSCSGPDKQFINVLNAPDKFQGQEIEVTGIVHERFEDNAIYLTANSETREALWVEYLALFMLLNTFEGLDGSKVKLRGQFDKNDKGHLGQYAGSLKGAIIIME